MTTREILRNKSRLLNVAKSLREAPVPKAFNMAMWVHDDVHKLQDGTKFDCGTPACALGHYASRRDLQKTFEIQVSSTDLGFGETEKRAKLVDTKTGSRVYFGDTVGGFTVEKHFGITTEQAEELFGESGCGNAKTPKDAAKYIENFVKRHF